MVETNAEVEKARKYYLTHRPRKNVVNICRRIPNWNGCGYCDEYAGVGLECWKQDGSHNCIGCEEVKRA